MADVRERSEQGFPEGIYTSNEQPIDFSSSRDDGQLTSLPLGHSTVADLAPTLSTKQRYDNSSTTPEPTSATTSSTRYTSPSSSETYDAVTKDRHTHTAVPASGAPGEPGLSAGKLAAAIVLPILAALLVLGLAFFLTRRRSRGARPRTGSGGSSSFLPVLREKWGSLRSSDSSTSGVPRTNEHGSGPVVTGTHNNAYFTGLDTSSHGGSDRDGASGDFAPERRSEGGTTFVIPPPPYDVNATPAMPPPVEPSGIGFDASRFLTTTLTPPPPVRSRDPESPVSPLQGPVSPLAYGSSPAELLSMPLDPPRPSSRSARSITSTLYSDTASVHSARAARRSVGPFVITPSSTSGHLGTGDPFDDPNLSMVRPLSAQEAEHRRV